MTRVRERAQAAPRMTKARLNRDAIWERLEQIQMDRMAQAMDRAKGPIVTRMAEVMAFGQYDRADDGCSNHLYRGPVAGEPFMAQAVALGDDLVICLWSAARDHTRRFLVAGSGDSAPAYWMETERGAAPLVARNKYYGAVKRIVCLHLHRRDRYDLTALGLTALADLDAKEAAGNPLTLRCTGCGNTYDSAATGVDGAFAEAARWCGWERDGETFTCNRCLDTRRSLEVGR